MNRKYFDWLMVLVAVTFSVFFAVTVIPALLQDGDVIGAFQAGFVNPYSSGYSLDVILCWVTLLIWVIYEARNYSIKYGWICVVLGVVPGVAVGLPAYLILRSRQFKDHQA